MNPTADVTIRPARTADVPALGALGAALMRAHYAFDSRRFLAPGDHPEAGYAAFLEAQLRNPEACVFVAERREGAAARIVGYVFAAVEPLSWKELRDRAGYIHDILIIEEARGTGLGTRLLETAIAWLRGHDVPRVLLWTAAANTRARALFEAEGFRPTMVEMTREL